MIPHRVVRVYVSDREVDVPKGYTFRSHLNGLIGLKSSNIHIHLGNGWDRAEGENSQKQLQQMIVNLSCNPKPPLITMGQFDPRLSAMLLALEVLDV